MQVLDNISYPGNCEIKSDRERSLMSRGIRRLSPAAVSHYVMTIALCSIRVYVRYFRRIDQRVSLG